MKNKMLVGFIIALVIVGGGSFYGGMVYGKSQAASQRNSAFGQRQGFGAGLAGGLSGASGLTRDENRAAGGFVNGAIIAQDDKSITVKSQSGGSKIIFLSDSTQITKSVDGSLADLAIDKNVTVTGSANSDGSLTAQYIQLRPDVPAGPGEPGQGIAPISAPAAE